jgi:hypothetical protein
MPFDGVYIFEITSKLARAMHVFVKTKIRINNNMKFKNKGYINNI